MLVERAAEKMIAFYKGDVGYINHFLKVLEFAQIIASLEKVDALTMETVRLAAVVHDIACPLCFEKYGSTAGNLQEAESEPILHDFFKGLDISPEMQNRVVYLVTHHHTYENVDGTDYQILLEADYLVNAGESEVWRKNLSTVREKMFKTVTGKRLLDSIFG